MTGKPIPPAPGALTSLKAGRGVSAARQPDGSIKFYADADGELVRDGTLISVQESTPSRATSTCPGAT